MSSSTSSSSRRKETHFFFFLSLFLIQVSLSHSTTTITPSNNSKNKLPPPVDCGLTTQSLIFYPGTETTHQTGYQFQTTAWQVTVQDTEDAYLTYGPYTNEISGQPMRVDFLLSIDNNSEQYQGLILVLDVNDANTETSYVSRDVYRTDFNSPAVPQNFSLFFVNSACSDSIEFRVYYYCCAEVTHHQTAVSPLDGGSFSSFWNLEANFGNFVSQSTFQTPGNPGATGANEGSYYVVLPNGVWYLFWREYEYTATPSVCSGVIDPFRIMLTTSTDQGQTWSNSTLVAQPTLGGPDECAIVDGAGYFDSETRTWHYLGQCIAATGGWSMCHYYLQSEDPTIGVWNVNPANPVVKSGQLFSQICAGTGKHCLPTMGEEGTPDIVEKRDGWFYVTFHGWDPANNAAARGIARTPDFVSWQVDGYELPDDAIFSSDDCNPWHITWAPGGCIGSGEGSILKSGDYYYQLIEAPDVTLGCETTYGQQNWVLGLVRSPSLYTPSPQWEEFSVNPVVIPWQKYGCALQYHRLFEDPSTGSIYLSFFINDFPTGQVEMKIFVLSQGYQSLPIVASIDLY